MTSKESWMVWWDQESANHRECMSVDEAWELYNSIESDHKAIMYHPNDSDSPTSVVAIGDYSWMSYEWSEMENDRVPDIMKNLLK